MSKDKPLNKILRNPNPNKKFMVYVRDKKTNNIKKVSFGDPNLSIKRDNPDRQKSFMARMGAVLKKVQGQKNLSPAYWAVKSWRSGTKIPT
jgi:hypothetical protein|tara:strand:+ start:315 stop:587 length:273 start_codon:yes stop_codon:yes gene_type:complete